MLESFVDKTKKVVETIKGNPKQKRVESISAQIRDLQASLSEHKNNLGITAEGLDRTPDDGGVTIRKEERIAQLRQDLEDAMREAA